MTLSEKRKNWLCNGCCCAYKIRDTREQCRGTGSLHSLDDNRTFLNSKSNLSRSGDACNSSPRGIVGHQGEQLDIEEQLGSWTAASWTEQLDTRVRTAGHQGTGKIIEDHIDDLGEIAGYGGTDGYHEPAGH